MNFALKTFPLPSERSSSALIAIYKPYAVTILWLHSNSVISSPEFFSRNLKQNI